MRPDIVPGATFPDYELRDHRNEPQRLSLLQGDDPLILTLMRGHFCPKDRQQLYDLAEFSQKLAVGYARLVTITTDSLMEVNELRTGVSAHWPFLHDPGRTIAQDLDIAEYTDPLHKPMIPYTIVLKPGLVIHTIYNGYWYWGRPTIHELHVDLRDITAEVRADYAIDTPELRAQWESGDKSSFWPYGKSFAEIFAEGD